MQKKLTLLFIALVATSVFASEVTEEDDVLVLTDDNFDSVLIQHQFILVEFYAPWCGHCKKLAPEYSGAAKTLKSTTPAVPLAKVDATANSKLGQRFKVQGYPTLKFFANGIDVDYTGGRTNNDIVNWITKRTGETTTSLADAESVKEFIDSTDVVLVYFAESESDEEYRVFKTVAMGYDDIKFGWTTDENARTAHSAKSRQVVLFKKFDERRNDFSGTVNSDNIKKFIDDHSFALVMPFNDRAIEKVFQKQNPTLFLFSNSNDASIEAEHVFERVAKSHKGEVLFSITKPDDGYGHYDRLGEYVGVDGKKAPLLMLVSAQGEVSKYKFESKEINEANIIKFIQDFKARRLTKYLKSEDVPETNDEPVKIIVGKTFNDIVINNNNDVLVEFYAPWCGHCKALAPIYDEFAAKLASNHNIVIAKVDATANEIPSVEIKSYPTLKFYQAGKKNKPLDFEGNRDLNGLVDFVKKHTTHSWTHDDL